MNANMIRRYERKYLVPDHLCHEIAFWVQGICDLDPFGQKAHDRAYTIHSLYYDTPTLEFYEEKEARKMDRAKPRVRFYGDRPGDQVWLEVKRKVNGVVIKSRGAIPTTIWPQVLEDSTTALDTSAVRAFAALVLGRGAVPTAHIAYRREAWISQIDSYARVTFDRAITAASARGSASLEVPSEDWTAIDGADKCHFHTSPTVLELKCEAYVPTWMMDLVRHFGLQEMSYSKYCHGVEVMV